MKTVLAQQDMESYASAFRLGIHHGMTNLFDAWYPSLCDYICSLINDRSSAEEIASEAFLKTWRHCGQFNSAGEIRAYLFTIAKRDAFRLQRQNYKRISFCDESQAASTAAPVTFENEIQETISDAVRTLPPRCRQIFELLYIEGKDTDEIAKQLVISPYTVRAHKARAIHLLRPKLLTALN